MEKGANVSRGNVIDAFVLGAKKGMNIAINAQIPNIVMAFTLISILNNTGLLALIEIVFSPIMGIFGLPGAAATSLMGAFMSQGGGIGAAMALFAAGDLSIEHLPILLPAIYLMGSQIQIIGRIGGTAGIPAKFITHMIVISVINAFIAMFVMNILTSIII